MHPRLGFILVSAATMFSMPGMARDSDSLAESAKLQIETDQKNQVIVGQAIGSAKTYFQCSSSRIQHTIQKCRLKQDHAGRVSFLGNSVERAPIEKVTVTIHSAGDVVNMSIDYGQNVDFDALIQQYIRTLGSEPKVEYWSDASDDNPSPEHLYESNIWIECDKTEVELTRVKKGLPDVPIRTFVSDLSGNRPLEPRDKP